MSNVAGKPHDHRNKQKGAYTMQQRLTAKQLSDYKQLCHDREYGRLLTPDGLRFVCESNEYDPEAIGRHFLEVLAKIESERR